MTFKHMTPLPNHSPKRNKAFVALKGFWAGIGKAMVLAPRLDYKLPTKMGGFSQDIKALQNDAHTVLADFNHEMAKQQSDHSQQ